MLATLRPVSSDAGGRSIPDPGYAGDDGSADADLVAAVAAHAADPARLPAVLAALHRARVLAPVVALLGETGTTADGLVHDKTADIAVPVLVDPDGARALPVFTDLAALARWDAAARPVPVAGPRAAQVALAEGAEALVLDLAGPLTVTLPLPELRALAEGRAARAVWEDPEVTAAVAALLEGEPAARSAHLAPYAGRDARLTVVVDPDADRAVLAARIGVEVAALPVLRGGVRGLDVAVVAAPDRAGPPC
jgi:hypothetical protein